MKFKPLGNRLLVERLEEVNKTSSGIIIPDAAKEKPLVGTVRAISMKAEKEGEVKINDRVLFEKYKGSEIKLDGKDFVVLEVEDLLGVLN